MNKPKDTKDVVALWQRDMEAFVDYFWPLDLVQSVWPTFKGWSTQQRLAMRELSKLVQAKLKWGYGAHDIMTDEEKEYAKKIGISIQSGNGTGKDTFMSLIDIWFNFCFPMSKNSVTANTEKQLKNVLWSEIAKMLRVSRKANPDDKETILQGYLVLQSEKMYLKEYKGKESFTEAVVVNTTKSAEEQAESIAGRHEDYQMFGIDEGSSINDAVYQKIERTLTRLLNIMVIIFNPTRSKGYAVDSQTDERFIAMRWNAEDSELVSQEHIDGMEKKYGRDSNPFRISILGLPPLVDEDTLIPWDWIEDAVLRDIIPDDNDRVIKGLDPGAGGDKSVICTRKGPKVYPLKRKTTADSEVLAGWCVSDIEAESPDVFRIDYIGIGWGVYGRLKNMADMKHIVKLTDFRKTSSDPEKYKNTRAEAYWRLREAFETGAIDIPDDKELKNQLGVIKYDSPNNKIQIIEKRKIKAELGHSPDEADALAITYAKDDRFVGKASKPPVYVDKNPHKQSDRKYSYMRK